MRLIRLALHRLAEKIQDFGFWLSGLGDNIVNQTDAYMFRLEQDADRPSRCRPIERMLLGSIVGLAICTLWIWFSARAGR